jgi:hypothetical protein
MVDKKGCVKPQKIKNQQSTSKPRKMTTKRKMNKEDDDREESLVKDEDGRSVAVVVVGEIGRNPRIQYHALELSR